jgi:hypothetical protein
MATRFDRVTTTTRVSEPDLDLDFANTALTKAEVALLTARSMPGEARRLAPAELGGAMIAWLSLVFTLCYVLGPTALALVGLPSLNMLVNLDYLLPCYVAAGFVAWVGAMVARPSVRLDGPRDPVLAASVGGLGVLLVAQNTLGWPFVTFGQMSLMELVCHVALNLVEMTLLGMMFASFTRRSSVAFALGAGFQLLSIGLQLTALSLIL